MTFVEMKRCMKNHFKEMTDDAEVLFEVDVDKDELWATYLDSFAPDKNRIFRERREHDCSCCRHFIKTVGNVVAIKDGKITTLWDFETNDDTYSAPIKAMRDYIRSKPITNVFYTSDKHIGTSHNFELIDGISKQWDHFDLNIPDKFVIRNGKSRGDYQGDFRDTRNVFKRSLDEISEDSITLVLELISQKSLYRGEEWERVLTQFLNYKKEYDKLSDEQKELYTWENSVKAGAVIGRIRNHSIGTLLINISEGMDLDTAVSKYEAIVAPTNYKRPKAIFTQKMLNDAKAAISEMGYMESLGRRYATLDDISVNNIIFSNKDAAKRISGDSVFDEMSAEILVNPKKFSKVEEIGIEDFISDVVPKASEIEILFENRLANNMVSLIAPKNKDSKTMFKWNNNFCWAYSGNITDSMKERVKSAGGKVDGDLRFSIQWNECGTDNYDLDAHCVEPGGYEIYYGSAKKPYFSPTRGQLDVDVIQPGGQIAVENITWANRNTMNDGTYLFYVYQYSGSVKNGFRAEVEFDGQVYSFDYSKSMRTGESISVAEITLKNGVFTIKEKLPSSVTSRDIWNIKSNQFVPVTVIMYSPNYWDEQRGIGNKHYFFMLKDCVNPENPNGFYNEFLNQELDKHKHVMEALGGKISVESADDQLRGVGFSSTKLNNIIVKVKGKIERTLKVNF